MVPVVFIGLVKKVFPEMALFHSLAARPIAVLSLAEKSVDTLRSNALAPIPVHFPIVQEPAGKIGAEDCTVVVWGLQEAKRAVKSNSLRKHLIEILSDYSCLELIVTEALKANNRVFP